VDTKKQLTPRSGLLLQKLIFSHPVKKFSSFYRTQNQITLFKRSRYLFPILNQINPVHILRSNLRSLPILSFHLCLDLSNGLFPSVFPYQSTIHVSYPIHLFLLGLITLLYLVRSRGHEISRFPVPSSLPIASHLMHKYLIQHSVLDKKETRSTFLPQCKRPILCVLDRASSWYLNKGWPTRDTCFIIYCSTCFRR